MTLPRENERYVNPDGTLTRIGADYFSQIARLISGNTDAAAANAAAIAALPSAAESLTAETLADLGTPAASDQILTRDVSDGNTLKYVLASSLSGGAGGGLSKFSTTTLTGATSFDIALPNSGLIFIKMEAVSFGASSRINTRLINAAGTLRSGTSDYYRTAGNASLDQAVNVDTMNFGRNDSTANHNGHIWLIGADDASINTNFISNMSLLGTGYYDITGYCRVAAEVHDQIRIFSNPTATFTGGTVTVLSA